MLSARLPTRGPLFVFGVLALVDFAVLAVIPFFALLVHHSAYGPNWAMSAAGFAAFVIYLVPTRFLGRATVALLATAVAAAAITGWGHTATILVLGGMAGYGAGFLMRMLMLIGLAHREAFLAANVAEHAESATRIAEGRNH